MRAPMFDSVVNSCAPAVTALEREAESNRFYGVAEPCPRAAIMAYLQAKSRKKEGLSPPSHAIAAVATASVRCAAADVVGVQSCAALAA